MNEQETNETLENLGKTDELQPIENLQAGNAPQSFDDLQPIEGLEPDASAKPPKKRGGFNAGMGIGAALGVFATGLICAIIIAIVVVHGKTVTLGSKGVSAVNSNQIVDSETAAKMDEIMAYIENFYYFDYDEDDMQDAILHALVSGMGDEYSVYYNEDETDDLSVTLSGNLSGIGAALKQDEDTKEVTISEVYEDTPAERAGLKAGDQILSADGNDPTEGTLDEFVSIIRGDEGTSVHLEIYRESTDETFELDVTRETITLKSVSYQMLEDNVGYIQVSKFQNDTADQFSAAIEDLQSQGMTSLIIDLRDNPGGLLDAVVAMLDEILPEGTVVYTENKDGTRQDYTSDAECLDIPIAVLINENSASASEIFAGAIKDYDYGTLIGTTTFGKGIVQSVFTLSDGTKLKLTTSAYYTPNGNNIHGTGIDPDIELEYEFQGTEDQDYDISLDNQIQYAKEYLTK